MEVTFYQFAKDNNSTKRPTSGYSVDVRLKSPCSVLSPTLEISTKLIQYNYVYIPSFSRYYWVTNWGYNQPFWICTLSVDPLASWKSAIGSSTQYVIRSASRYNGYIPDAQYPVSTDTTSTYNITSALWSNDFANAGFFIVGIIGKGTATDTTESGLVNYYAMDVTAFNSFKSALFDDTLAFYKSTGSFGDVSDEIVRLLVDSFKYVASCVWVPFMPSSETPVSGISIGFWQWTKPTSGLCYKISVYTTKIFTTKIALPKHPQQDRGAYVNGPGFARYVLRVPGAGTLEIPAIAAVDHTHIAVTLRLDAYSGAGKVVVSAINDPPETENEVSFPILEQNVCIAVPVTLANSERATGDLANGALSVLGSAVTGNYLGAIGGAIGTVENMGQVNTALVGSNGNYEWLRGGVSLTAIFFKIANDMPARYGRPLCDAVQIDTLAGFVQCNNAHFDAEGCYDPEAREIEIMLNGGIYYE